MKQDITRKVEAAKKLLQEAQQELNHFLTRDRSRQRGSANRLAHEVSGMLGQSKMFFSQAGQDMIVDRILQGKRHGVFADIGGYDGVSGSNTLFFEVFRKWTGVLVEASPTQNKRAADVRMCPCVNAAVGATTGQMAFLEVTKGYTQMSGLLDSYSAEMLTKVRENPNHREVIHQLKVSKLADILSSENLSAIDYLSLDVEGGEMEIIADFPFGDFDIELISIENNSHSSELPKLMKSNGYNLVEFAGVDDLFRKNTA